MESRRPELPDDVRAFLRTYWDTDVRLTSPSADARFDMKLHGIDAAVRRFLTDAIRGLASPETWSKLFNAQTYTSHDVKQDATEFWMWLYDGAPLPKEGGESTP